MRGRRLGVRVSVLSGIAALLLAAGCGPGDGRAGHGVVPISEPREVAQVVLDALPPLTPGRLATHVEYLADAALAGRFPGTAGIARAERYIADRMSMAGLEPPDGLDDHFHPVDLYRSDYDPDGTSVTAFIDGVPLTRVAPPAMRSLFMSDTGTVTAPVVFAGYGITAAEHDWDDYQRIDPTDRIVLVYRYEPSTPDALSRFAGDERSDHSLFITKATNARDRGAAGMILATGPLHGSAPEDFRTIRTLQLSPHSIEQRFSRLRLPGFFAAHISQPELKTMLAPFSLDPAILQRELDAGLAPARIDLDGLTATISVAFEEHATTVPGHNVVGILPADAPGAPWIVIGAHHDHLGSFGDDPVSVYHGADDNASGVAGVLELASYFATEPRARNLAFVTFTAEEEGFLGSRAFVRDRIIAPDAIELMVNLDMIGRNPDEPLRVYASQNAAKIVDDLVGVAAELDVEIVLRERIDAVSDHYPFHEKGIPVVSLFTGRHEDYHQVTDTPDRLDYDRMERILRLVAGTVERLLSEPYAPAAEAALPSGKEESMAVFGWVRP